jgi:hypothetical protein
MDKQLGENQVANPMRHSVPDSPESKLLGADITQVPDLVKEADPTTWVSVDDPPFLIQHGTEDNLVPYQGSVILARELGKAPLVTKTCTWNFFRIQGTATGRPFTPIKTSMRYLHFSIPT